jgi:antitoxin MazE
MEMVIMVTKIQKWGNSQGLRIAREVLEDARVAVGDEVDVSAKGGIIVIKPVKRVRGRHKLNDLLSRIPRDYRAEEVDWGEPRGREAW